MATYNNINFQSEEDVTENYKFVLMGEDYQTSALIYRANLERIIPLVDALIFNSMISAPSGNNYKINKIEANISKSSYNGKANEEGNERGLYFIRRSNN